MKSRPFSSSGRVLTVSKEELKRLREDKYLVLADSQDMSKSNKYATSLLNSPAANSLYHDLENEVVEDPDRKIILYIVAASSRVEAGEIAYEGYIGELLGSSSLEQASLTSGNESIRTNLWAVLVDWGHG